jgi:hypothetical protein
MSNYFSKWSFGVGPKTMENKSKKNYRLYIDESGDHRYGKKNTIVSTMKYQGKEIKVSQDNYVELEDNQKRYLSLTACMIDREFYKKTLCNEMEKLKKNHFNSDPDDSLIFHREDMVNKRGPFYRLRNPEKENAFNVDLLAFLRNMDYIIITVVIDKKAHIEKYSTAAYHPYHYCLMAILERYCGLLSFLKAKGDVLAESRGGREDEQLKMAYRELYNGGSKWMPKTHFQTVLTSKEIKLKKKNDNILGLQLADLLAHPLKLHVLINKGIIPEQKDFGAQIVKTVIKKFNRHRYNGKIDGYGRILL